MQKRIKLKCLWCGKRITQDNLQNINYINPIFNNEALFVCSEEHKTKALSFLEVARNYYKISYFGLRMGIILYPVLALLFKNYFHIITMIMAFDFGIGLFIFPFTTPALIKNFGIKKSVIIAKVISTISLLFGFSLLGNLLK
jgi:hypothetical protein